VKDDALLVTKGPRENNFRPAADALFRSAAVAYGPAVVGVVLTGMLHDGTAGLEIIKRCGGVAVVQDPRDAEFSSMPESALRNVAIDHVLPLAGMGAALVRIVAQLAPRGTASIPEDIIQEAAIAERVVGNTEDVEKLGRLVALTCPDCGGNLWDVSQGKVSRYRCHTGHSFTGEFLLNSTQHLLEETLWVALRMMEERKNLLGNICRAAGRADSGNEKAHQPAARISPQRPRPGPRHERLAPPARLVRERSSPTPASCGG
jgi:two-component system chemotaxis response regulator CheB